MLLLDNHNSGFKTQLHENNVMDLTQNFYPGNPERHVLGAIVNAMIAIMNVKK